MEVRWFSTVIWPPQTPYTVSLKGTCVLVAPFSACPMRQLSMLLLCPLDKLSHSSAYI